MTIVGLRKEPYQVPWDAQLTLSAVILKNGGLGPFGQVNAVIQRILPDGSESKTTYDLRRFYNQTPIDDPKLQAGDRVTFWRPGPFKY